MKIDKVRVRKNQRGYTLLEYCAGAAIIASILWGALSSLGGNLEGLLKGVGAWAQHRTDQISAADGGSTTTH